jgi:hypothetical protein
MQLCRFASSQVPAGHVELAVLGMHIATLRSVLN